jgi:hypothetical protein
VKPDANFPRCVDKDKPANLVKNRYLVPNKIQHRSSVDKQASTLSASRILLDTRPMRNRKLVARKRSNPRYLGDD